MPAVRREPQLPVGPVKFRRRAHSEDARTLAVDLSRENLQPLARPACAQSPLLALVLPMARDGGFAGLWSGGVVG